jgi:hypothetical protein
MIVCQYMLAHYLISPVQVPAGSKLQFLGRNIRAEQMMQSELEFEWLRQFYIQGHRHRELHAWWGAPMQELLRLWGELQGRLVATLEVLKAASTFDYRSEFATMVSGHICTSFGSYRVAESFHVNAHVLTGSAR